MKLLITGSDGQLGRCLLDKLSSGNHEYLAIDKDQLDITDSQSVSSMVSEFNPDVIVNAAAYTAVDKAESDEELAYKVNAIGPKNLAQAAAKNDIPLIHVSTDYVFNGAGYTPYMPYSEVKPMSVYGETKLAGEKFVTEISNKSIIIRTAWVFSEHGNNFVKTMLRLAKDRDELGIVADQYGCPTYAGDLAELILTIIDDISESKVFNAYGTYHFCGAEATSWHGFARTIFAMAEEKNVDIKKPNLNAIRTEDFPTPAARPYYSVLDCSNTDSIWKVNRNWQLSLSNVLSIL